MPPDRASTLSVIRYRSSGRSTTATYTAVLVAHNNYLEASLQLQESFYHIQRWLKKWRIKANGTKSVQVFTT